MNIADTITFIQLAHGGQNDRAGKPYWTHPVSVMTRLGDDATEEERIAALLHDILEDTDYTADGLLALGFSGSVVEAVKLLTRPAGPTYMEWIRSIAASGNRTAIRVKIADNDGTLTYENGWFVFRHEHRLEARYRASKLADMKENLLRRSEKP